MFANAFTAFPFTLADYHTINSPTELVKTLLLIH